MANCCTSVSDDCLKYTWQINYQPLSHVSTFLVSQYLKISSLTEWYNDFCLAHKNSFSRDSDESLIEKVKLKKKHENIKQNIIIK